MENFLFRILSLTFFFSLVTNLFIYIRNRRKKKRKTKIVFFISCRVARPLSLWLFFFVISPFTILLLPTGDNMSSFVFIVQSSHFWLILVSFSSACCYYYYCRHLFLDITFNKKQEYVHWWLIISSHSCDLTYVGRSSVSYLLSMYSIDRTSPVPSDTHSIMSNETETEIESSTPELNLLLVGIRCRLNDNHRFTFRIN